MPRIVVLSPIPEDVMKSLFAVQMGTVPEDWTMVTAFGSDKEHLKLELSQADVVIGDYTMKIRIDSDLVDSMKKVKLIAEPSTGYDHIDVEACRKKGIPVSNIGGANRISVAEHTLALALILMKRIEYAHSKILQDAWVQSELLGLATELYGKTWGIVGMGRIGREVAVRAIAMGAKVMYENDVRLESADEEGVGVQYSTLGALLEQSDVVSVHVPLTESTRRMIGEKELRTMKPNAVFINVSRGELTDEHALARAVTEGWIAGAGVDVFAVEPVPADHPLVIAAKKGANIVLTPHTAGATLDARNRIIGVTVQNVVRVLKGQQPENVVNG